MEHGLATLEIPEQHDVLEMNDRSDHSAVVQITRNGQELAPEMHTSVTVTKGAADTIRTPEASERLPRHVLMMRCMDFMRRSNVHGMRELLESQGIPAHERGAYYREVSAQATTYG